MNIEKITSTQNPKIKHLLLLQQKSSQRRTEGLFVVEGAREIKRCLHGGFSLSAIFFCPSIMTPDNELMAALATTPAYELSQRVYEQVAYRGSTEGIIAEGYSHSTSLGDITLSDNPLIIVLERVEKPGNLGAILRTADGVGADAVVVCDPLTDIFNPNIIRSSLGTVFTIACTSCTTAECIAFLRKKNIQIITSQLQDATDYYSADLHRPTALVMGSEATGLSTEWREAADAHIRIPMLGQADSLNVATSAAILAYEALRQRQPAPTCGSRRDGQD